MKFKESRLVFEVSSIGRSISDDGWEEIDAAHIDYWREAVALLKSGKATVRGQSLSWNVEWQPMVDNAVEHYALQRRLHAPAERGDELNKATLAFLRKRVQIPIEVKSALPETAETRLWIGKTCVESFLYDSFVVLSLSAPGICNFNGATLKSVDGGFDVDTRFFLSDYSFDIAFLEGRDGKWPCPEMIPLRTVVLWYSLVRSSTAQVPQNRMEKVLFAIMHIAASELSPATVIWIFYALETLFDTKVGENFRVLVERIRLLLSPTQQQLGQVRRSLRELYSVRSSFVHGGLEVAHPMNHEGLDEAVEATYRRLMDSTEFGFRLLLCAVQKTINEGWRCPLFEEVLSGERVGGA